MAFLYLETHSGIAFVTTHIIVMILMGHLAVRNGDIVAPVSSQIHPKAFKFPVRLPRNLWLPQAQRVLVSNKWEEVTRLIKIRVHGR